VTAAAVRSALTRCGRPPKRSPRGMPNTRRFVRSFPIRAGELVAAALLRRHNSRSDLFGACVDRGQGPSGRGSGVVAAWGVPGSRWRQARAVRRECLAHCIRTNRAGIRWCSRYARTCSAAGMAPGWSGRRWNGRTGWCGVLPDGSAPCRCGGHRSGERGATPQRQMPENHGWRPETTMVVEVNVSATRRWMVAGVAASFAVAACPGGDCCGLSGRSGQGIRDGRRRGGPAREPSRGSWPRRCRACTERVPHRTGCVWSPTRASARRSPVPVRICSCRTHV
jgi:hypothetical protein